MLGIKTIVLSSYEYLCLTLLLLFDEKQVHINQTKEKYDQIDQRHIQRPSQQQRPTRWQWNFYGVRDLERPVSQPQNEVPLQ